MSTTGGESRVSIPTNIRHVIHQLSKTQTHKHSDQFLYTTLKDSAMDPTEATRRLDMVHHIQEIAGKHSVEDVYTMLKDCNLDANEAAQRLLYIDTFHVVKKKHDRRKTISNEGFRENMQTRGNQWRGDKGGRGAFYSSKVFEDVGGGRNSSSGKEHGASNRVERVLRPPLQGQTGKENNVVHVSNSRAKANGTPALSNGNHNHKHASESPADVASSALDHAMVSSQNTKHICAVGTIKCEIVKRSGSNESNAISPAGTKLCADQLGTATIPVIAEAADAGLKSTVAEKKQISESLQPVLLPTPDSSQVVNPIQDNQLPVQLSNEPLKVSEEEPELALSTPKHDVMVGKPTLSSHQAVIFPDHLQVPENYKCQFIFGSLDATDDDCKSISVTESTQQNEAVKEPTLSNGNASTVSQEGEIKDRIFEDVFRSEVNNISSDSSAIIAEQTKVDIAPPPPSSGFQNLPVLPTTRDYYSYMPPLMGPHYVQLDVPDVQQNGNSQAVTAAGQPSVTQPAMAGQGSVALSPPLFPYFRPYPNYIPYNPYFPHMYLPQTAHLLNHGVFPQPPPPAANAHHLQAAAAAVKTPTPSQNNHESNEDITSEANDDGSVSTVQQTQQDCFLLVEDLQARAHAPVHDLHNMLPNYFYTYPQGQHMAAFSHLQAAALYHSLTGQSTIPPPLMYQPPPTGATIEPHQQPHAPQVIHQDTALMNTGTG
ncbi:uncharacterized protein LOC143579007 [Bidens hawaiensis]|uniref:uncharacterized protein LOC143579007 n=1 Tax=Bidens hawaiensis TaxID=980011 RepID=UPI00404A783E